MKTEILTIAAIAGAAALAAGSGQPARAQGYDAPPPGSYWQTCQNVRVSGGGGSRTLSADCRDVRGAWRGSSLRYTDCRGEIENRDGQLTCFTGRPDQGGYPPPTNNGYGGGYGSGGYGSGGGYGGAYGSGGYRNGGYGSNSGYPDGPPVRGGSITLYYGVNFSGPTFGSNREITNLPKRDNDKAMSLKVSRGSAWQVCTDSDFRGRCQVFNSDVRDLNQFGMGEAVSSMRQVR